MDTFIIQEKNFPAGGRAEWRTKFATQATSAKAALAKYRNHDANYRALTVEAARKHDPMNAHHAIADMNRRNSSAPAPVQVHESDPGDALDLLPESNTELRQLNF